MRSLTEHIAEAHGFALDPKETVLVGLCAKCAGKKDGEADADVADHTERCDHCL